MPRKKMSKPVVSTLAVTPEIADRVRTLARNNGMSHLEMTNHLLEFALSQGKIEIQVQRLVVSPRSSKK